MPTAEKRIKPGLSFNSIVRLGRAASMAFQIIEILHSPYKDPFKTSPLSVQNGLFAKLSSELFILGIKNWFWSQICLSGFVVCFSCEQKTAERSLRTFVDLDSSNTAYLLCSLPLNLPYKTDGLTLKFMTTTRPLKRKSVAPTVCPFVLLKAQTVVQP